MFIYFLSVVFYLCIYPVFERDYLPLFNPISWSLDHCCSHVSSARLWSLSRRKPCFTHWALSRPMLSAFQMPIDWKKRKMRKNEGRRKVELILTMYVACLHSGNKILFHYGGAWRSVTQSCPPLCDPMDCTLLGPSVHGISQARTLEQAAISFSSRPSQHSVS